MKNKTIILAALAIALALVVLTVILLLLPGLLNRGVNGTEDGAGRSPDSVEQYLAENWTTFRLRSWDQTAGSLALDSPWELTYEQMRRHGAEQDFDAMVQGEVENLKSLQLCLELACGVKPKTITVRGLSSDGQEVYTADLNGLRSACWHESGGQ